MENEAAAVALEVPEPSIPLKETHTVTETAPVIEEPVAAVEPAGDFAAENKVNMWDSIKTVEEEDAELDVPPSLRKKLRGRK